MKHYQIRVWAVVLLFFLLSTNLPSGFSQNNKLPDLFLTEGNVNPRTVKAGRSIDVVATVLNQGKRPSGAFRVRFFLSTDETITTDDLDTGVTFEIDGLLKRRATSRSLTIPIPASLKPGEYLLGAIVDDQNVIVEKDESNNSRSVDSLTVEAADGEGEPEPPPAGTITVDGDPSDWAGITPILTDQEGDGPFDASGRYEPGSDLLQVSIANDNETVFLLVKFAGAPYAGGLAMYFDTDVNLNQGCNGLETAIHTSAAEPGAHLALADYRGCVLVDDAPGKVVSAAQERDGRSFVEISIRRDDLFRFTPGRQDLRFYATANLGGTADLTWPPTVYSLTERHPDGANLQIGFDANPIFPDPSGPCRTGGAWHYGLTLTETAGVGLTIMSYKTVLYDANGGYLVTLGSQSAAEFAAQFSACGAESSHIGANGKACSQPICLDVGGRSSGQIDITFSGFDDKGNPVRFTSPRLVFRGL